MGPGVTLTLLTPDRYYNRTSEGVNAFWEIPHGILPGGGFACQPVGMFQVGVGVYWLNDDWKKRITSCHSQAYHPPACHHHP